MFVCSVVSVIYGRWKSLHQLNDLPTEELAALFHLILFIHYILFIFSVVAKPNLFLACRVLLPAVAEAQEGC